VNFRPQWGGTRLKSEKRGFPLRVMPVILGNRLTKISEEDLPAAPGLGSVPCLAYQRTALLSLIESTNNNTCSSTSSGNEDEESRLFFIFPTPFALLAFIQRSAVPFLQRPVDESRTLNFQSRIGNEWMVGPHFRS